MNGIYYCRGCGHRHAVESTSERLPEKCPKCRLSTDSASMTTDRLYPWTERATPGMGRWAKWKSGTDNTAP